MQASRVLILVALFSFVTASATAQQKMVFAHYMVTNQDYLAGGTNAVEIASYEREIQQAQAAGIDGFALNEGGWFGNGQQYYLEHTGLIFEAALALNSGFKLFINADMCCGNNVADVEDMVRRFANNPRYASIYFASSTANVNGISNVPVLTTFLGDSLGTSAWAGLRSDLATGANPSTNTDLNAISYVSGAPSNADVQIFFVPVFFWGGDTPATADIQTGFNEWAPYIDGSFYWGITGIPGSGGSYASVIPGAETGDPVISTEDFASVVHKGGKLYMGPIAPQFWGAQAVDTPPHAYYEYSGGSGMRKMWMDAINVSKPDWIEIITWNDFIEGTYISPIDDPNKYVDANYLVESGLPTWPTQPPLGYFHSHMGATSLLPFYIQWYKSGVEPTTTNDSIYWFYRTQPMAYFASLPIASAATNFGPMADVIYITANLRAPATLIVTSGATVTNISVPAGSTDVTAPFSPSGTAPTFELMRGGGVAIQTTQGTDPIMSTPSYNDYYYSSGFAVGAPAPPTHLVIVSVQ